MIKIIDGLDIKVNLLEVIMMPCEQNKCKMNVLYIYIIFCKLQFLFYVQVARIFFVRFSSSNF